MAMKLKANKTDQCYIESNNGGRGFARAVQSLLLKNKYKGCKIVPLRQTQNKIARIKTQAQWIAKNVMMPKDWKNNYKTFSLDLTRFSLQGKNKNDDAPDCLTGCAEWHRKLIKR
jgi:predicted phage terminase large subunit-like protein